LASHPNLDFWWPSLRIGAELGDDRRDRNAALVALAAANENRSAGLCGGDTGGVVIELTRDQFNARLANGHQLELFEDGKRCGIVGRDEEAELE
jgi:hypothetical protein